MRNSNFRFIFVLVFISCSASANNYYVDNAVAVSGNGTSWNSAWKSFGAITWSSIKPGDTIYISGGTSSKTYYETLTIGASGASGLPITVTKGIDPGHNGTATIDAQNTRGNGIYSYERSHLTIQNLRVQNVTDAGIIVKYATGGILIQDNYVYSGGRPSTSAGCSGTWYNARGYDVRNSSGVVVRRNTYHTPSNIEAQTDGIWISGNNGVVVEENKIYIENNNDACHNDCIQAYQNLDNITIKNNLCHQLGSPNSSYSNHGDNHNHGLWLEDTRGGKMKVFNNVIYLAHQTYAIGVSNPTSGYSGSYEVYNNTVYGGNPAVYIGNSSTTQVKNNIIQPHAGGTAFHITSTAPPAANINNNLVFSTSSVFADVLNSNKTWASWQSMGYDLQGLNADPKFTNVSGLDFRLQSTSPAINKAVALTDVSADFDGATRPNGTAPDIGAYEFLSSPSPTPIPEPIPAPTPTPLPTDTAAPSVPQNLIATVASSSKITLSWSRSSDNVGVAGYRVQRNGVIISTVTGTSFSNSGLSANTIYTFKVQALDSAGNTSGLSVSVSAKTKSKRLPRLQLFSWY